MASLYTKNILFQCKARDQVHGKVLDKVHDRVHDQVHEKVHDKVHAKVHDKVRDKVHVILHDKLHDTFLDQAPLTDLRISDFCKCFEMVISSEREGSLILGPK